VGAKADAPSAMNCQSDCWPEEHSMVDSATAAAWPSCTSSSPLFGYGLLCASRAFVLCYSMPVVSGGCMALPLFLLSRIVRPLSAAAKRFPFSLELMISGVVIHIFCVGLPISLSVRRFSK